MIEKNKKIYIYKITQAHTRKLTWSPLKFFSDWIPVLRAIFFYKLPELFIFRRSPVSSRTSPWIITIASTGFVHHHAHQRLYQLRILKYQKEISSLIKQYRKIDRNGIGKMGWFKAASRWTLPQEKLNLLSLSIGFHE